MRIFFFVAFFLISVSSSSQTISSNNLYSSVVLLREQINNRINSGTGFLLKEDSTYYLVTAKHVADSLHIDFSEIYFRNTEGKAQEYKIKQFLTKDNFLKFNNNSDFFIVQLVPFDTTSLNLLQNCSVDANLLLNARTSLPRNIDVLVFGYPIYDLENFSPITFKSNFASGLMNIGVNGLPKPCYCYLLENPSMEGFSGGPVFAGVTDRATIKLKQTLIVGIVTGTTYDKTGGKFAIISPSYQLLDLIKN